MTYYVSGVMLNPIHSLTLSISATQMVFHCTLTNN